MADATNGYGTYSKLGQPHVRTTSNDWASPESSQKDVSTAKNSRGVIDRINDSWFWESVCLLLGFGSFGGICAALAVFSDRALPTWPLGITLNALVSFLSTLSKAALLVPISQSIAQIKWVHYSRRERPLYDLQLLDSASRGALGSVQCVLRRRGGIVPVFGGIAFILAILLDPFTQQVLTYPTREVRKADMATVSKSTTFPSQTNSLQSKTRAAIYSGIMSPNATYIPSTLSCPTGNCEWSTYSQLGVCAETRDVSSLVNIDCSLKYNETDGNNPVFSVPAVNDGGPWCRVVAPGPVVDPIEAFAGQTVAFPTVYFARDDAEFLNIAAGTNTNLYIPMPAKRDVYPHGSGDMSTDYGWVTSYQPISSPDTGAFFASLYTVYKSSSTLISPTNFTGFFMATETLFSLCSQSLKVTVNKGIPHVSTVGTYAPNESYADGSDQNFKFTAPGSPESYLVDDITLYDLSRNVANSLNSSDVAAVLYDNVVRRPDYTPPTDANELPPDDPGSRTWMPDHFNKIKLAGDGLATSLTRNIQDFANITINGDVFERETYVHIRWQWLALHGVLMAVTILLLGYTILATSLAQVGCWKSSVWPHVLLVDGDTRDELGEMSKSTASLVDDRSKRLRVNFQQRDPKV